MADKIFTITELRKATSGRGMSAYAPTGVKFEWSAKTKNIPEGSWSIPVRQRTVREDYPGAEEPVEQVLGWNFEPFTLTGKWDDRYMGPGEAKYQYDEFEKLVKRGNMVRFQFEGQSITGIIVNFIPGYRRADEITYSFEVSPHHRVLGETVRRIPIPRTSVDPKQAIGEALVRVQEMESAHRLAGGHVDTSGLPVADLGTATPDYGDPSPFDTSGDLFESFDDLLGSLFGTVAEARLKLLDPVIEVRGDGENSLLRAAYRFRTLKGYCEDAIEALNDASTTDNLAFESAIGILEYETWARTLAATARITRLEADRTEKALNARVEPKAIAIYRPTANENVYAVSNRFYGTPHEWRRILDRNNISSIQFAGTELLVIPEL